MIAIRFFCCNLHDIAFAIVFTYFIHESKLEINNPERKNKNRNKTKKKLIKTFSTYSNS